VRSWSAARDTRSWVEPGVHFEGRGRDRDRARGRGQIKSSAGDQTGMEAEFHVFSGNETAGKVGEKICAGTLRRLKKKPRISKRTFLGGQLHNRPGTRAQKIFGRASWW